MTFDMNLPLSELNSQVDASENHLFSPRMLFSRRGVLITSVGALTSLVAGSSAAAAEGSVLLQPSGKTLFRVRTEMDVKGNVNVPNNPLVSRKGEVKLPIKSKAVFDFEERYYRPEDADPASVVSYVQRYYHEASSESVLNRNSQTTKLRDSVKSTVIRRDSLPEVVYGVEDYFQRDELDLLRVPASSVAVDELLPNEAVSVGSRYMPSVDAMVSLLNLSVVETSDVTMEVMSIDDAEARLQFRGNVAGSLEGVPTTIRTIGKLTFDRQLGTCTWLAMAVHETREVSKAEPGFDVTATIRMIRKPLDQSTALDEPATDQIATSPIPSERLYVDLRSQQLGFSVLMDRDWRMMNDVAGAAMMRMIRNDRSIAQCDFRPLVALEAGAQWTLEAFQQDVKTTLGEQLSELIEADQRVTSSGLRVLRVTASGAVEGIPIQWVLMHFSDDSGRRLLATFTMEGENVEKFAGTDVQVGDSLSFTKLPPKAEKSASYESSDEDSSRVAKANSAEFSDDEVGSASDLK